MDKIYVLTYSGKDDVFVEAYSTNDKMRKRIEELLDDASMFHERTFTNIEELADNTEERIDWYETDLK